MALWVSTSQGEFPVDAAALGEQHPLAEGEHLDGQADVDGQLEQQRVLVVADEGHGVAELPQDRFGPPEGVRVAADDDGEAAVRCRRHAAGHGRGEHRGAAGLDPCGEIPAAAGADRAHVDVHLAGVQPGEDAVGSRGDGVQRVAVGDHADHDVCGLGHLAGGVAPAQPAPDQPPPPWLWCGWCRTRGCPGTVSERRCGCPSRRARRPRSPVIHVSAVRAMSVSRMAPPRRDSETVLAVLQSCCQWLSAPRRSADGSERSSLRADE